MRISSIANINYTPFQRIAHTEPSALNGLISDYPTANETLEAQKRYHLAVAKIEYSSTTIKEKANKVIKKAQEYKKEMTDLYKVGQDIQKDAKNIYKEISHLSSLENGNWRNDTIKIKHSDENETPHRVSIQKFSKDGKLKIEADYGNYDTYIRVFDENEKPEKVYKFIGGTLRDARIISYNKIEAFEYSHYGDLTSYKDKEKTIDFSGKDTGTYTIVEINQPHYHSSISTIKKYDFGSSLLSYTSKTRGEETLFSERIVFNNEKLKSYNQSTQTWSQLEYDCKFNNGEIIQYTKIINGRPIVDYTKNKNLATLKELYSSVGECYPYYETFSTENGILKKIKRTAMFS